MKPVVPFGYIDDFAYLNQQTGIMTGRVAYTYPDDEGFAYAGQVFEKTPFGRQLESGLPGKEYAIDPEQPRHKRQTIRMSYDTINIPGLDLQKDRYHYVTTTSIDGNIAVSIVNSQKQQVAFAALGKDTTVIAATNTEYIGTTTIETNYLPVYFEGNLSAKRVNILDYQGKLLSQTDYNLDGEIRYCYNSFGEMRFSQTPDLAAKAQFVYQKFDEMRRIIETGICSDPWEKAIQRVDDPTYPKSNLATRRINTYSSDIRNIGSFAKLVSTQTIDADGTLGPVETYTYDPFGRNDSSSISINGKTFTRSWKYDNNGNIISITNVDGTTLNYTFDSSGRTIHEDISTIHRERLTSFSYYANDMIKSLTTQGGNTEYGYTPAGWINSIKSPLFEEALVYKGTKISEFTLKLNIFDANIPSNIRYELIYDDFGRLQKARCFGDKELMEDISISSVSYDVNGNILDMKVGNRLKKYLYEKDRDRLLGVDCDNDFTYNPDGAVISYKSKGIESIEYKSGRPVSFKTKQGNFDVIYNIDGNRLAKIRQDGKETFYLYDGNNKLSVAIDSDGNCKQYLYGAYGMRGIIDKDGFSDIYTDHLGSPRMVGRKGDVVSAMYYTPYGKPMPIIGSMEAGFNGYRMDEETGLYYSHFRLYDPDIGRFLSIDPKTDSESPYVFAGNDPINRADPQGDKWWGVLLGIAVGIIGAVATFATCGALAPVAMGLESATIGSIITAEAVITAPFVAASCFSGAVGSIAGDLTTHACNKTPITAKMAVGSLVVGALSGLGVLAGPIAQSTTSPLYKKLAGDVGRLISDSLEGPMLRKAWKIKALGATIGAAVGAGAAVSGNLAYVGITGNEISGTSIAIAALAGMGMGLLQSQAYVSHVTKVGDLHIDPNRYINDFNELSAITGMKGAVKTNSAEWSGTLASSFPEGDQRLLAFFRKTEDVMDTNDIFQNIQRQGVYQELNSVTIAYTGIDDIVLVPFGNSYRPMQIDDFVTYLTGQPKIVSVAPSAPLLELPVAHIKMVNCYSALPGLSDDALQRMADGLGHSIYASDGFSGFRLFNRRLPN